MPLLTDLMAMTETLARHRGVHMVLQNPEIRLSAPIDPELVEQAIHGLLVNSIEASPPGGTVTIALGADAQRITLTLCDEGAGLSYAPEAGKLTPGPTTKRAGTGLGIPFALKVFEIHGGGVQFALRPEGGTQALLWLPHA